jgi:hypothetical protein
VPGSLIVPLTRGLALEYPALEQKSITSRRLALNRIMRLDGAGSKEAAKLTAP